MDNQSKKDFRLHKDKHVWQYQTMSFYYKTNLYVPKLLEKKVSIDKNGKVYTIL